MKQKKKKRPKKKLDKKDKNTVDECSLCGMCKVSCPVFRVTRSETDSPRAKAILKLKKSKDPIFYKCTLCDACLFECGAKVDLELVEERKRLVKQKVELETNSEMIKNVREYGNPFGKPGKKDPKNLYCC